MVYWLAFLIVDIILIGGTFLLVKYSKGWSSSAIKISVSFLIMLALTSVYFFSLILPT